MSIERYIHLVLLLCAFNLNSTAYCKSALLHHLHFVKSSLLMRARFER